MYKKSKRKTKSSKSFQNRSNSGFKNFFTHQKIITLYQAGINKTFFGNFIPYHISRKSYIFSRIALALFLISIISFSYISAPIIFAQIELNNSSHLKLGSPTFPVKPKIYQFQLIIPKIGLNAPVIPGVDINSVPDYTAALKKGIAQAKGSYLPGEKGPVFLFSHSTDTVADIATYNAKFYGLKNLVIGDPVEIVFNHKIFHYRITKMNIIPPDNIKIIQDSHQSLIMQTCWPPGTDLQRLIVYANQT